MSFVQTAIRLGETWPWPDSLSIAVIEKLVARTRVRLSQSADDADRLFARAMSDYPIAINTDDANAQHYELPSEFFALVLGPQRKYSSCLYTKGTETLAEAEELALAATARHADLADGQRILELGCGWGSLSLWMARQFPRSQIVSVSNSHSQRAFIEQRAQAENLTNLHIVTADMNDFKRAGRFDRVVSVEMFEHMSNWHPLLARIRDCLEPDGRLFLHVFSHARAPYRFGVDDREDWIAQHFFTGGIMPSHDLIRQFPDCFEVEQEWRWNGTHYQRTAKHWLDNFDRNADKIRKVLDGVYGPSSALWYRRWRLFFLATSGLFGHAGGKEWGVSHYRLAPVPGG
jgi:cyclopropane-fatty-acyl-phospholipid synthase